ncbi:MAG: hypothetical protein HC916_00960 [Coleofasciculaceae cyanobacterium SM2_1_6]|nr:hypothetical protein [Coleofasciculaceae cyanobacterium SM2_1_6]
MPAIKPGDSVTAPITEISRILSQLCPRSDTKKAIYALIDAGNLAAAIDRLPGQENLLLIVDQFEEVFTVCPEEQAKQKFIDLLVGITQYPQSRLRVVTTMRADFFDKCLAYRALGTLIQEHQVLLLPMEPDELQEVIEEPIKGKYTLGEGLLPMILRDIRQEPNVLPLLEFALTQLWEQRTDRCLTLSTYDALG